MTHRDVCRAALLSCLCAALFLSPASNARAGEDGGKTPERRPTGRNEVPGMLHFPTGLIPVTDLGLGKYKGEEGGLYGEGKNEPPEALIKLAQKALARIKPLDAEGRPAENGKVALISVGMSNTTEEFSTFVPLAMASSEKAPHVLVVDTAQGARTAEAWATSARAGSRSSGGGTVWDEANRRIQAAGASPRQVQAVWIKVAGSIRKQFPDSAREFQGHLAAIAATARTHYPNLQVAYFTSRIYAGYATGSLNPEPWSYETAFGIRWVIRQQLDGDPTLNADPERGEVKAPVLLWGPYLWADGTKPRSDGMVWKREDLAADGIHPSPSGRQIVARELLKFFTTDPLAKPWFAR
ncbi:MAG: hypothetical protein M5U26_23840 [Planctomycetota bacterium]|nr:hypothetical protein [Planctomycetota bacterium]